MGNYLITRTDKLRNTQKAKGIYLIPQRTHAEAAEHAVHTPFPTPRAGQPWAPSGLFTDRLPQVESSAFGMDEEDRSTVAFVQHYLQLADIALEHEIPLDDGKKKAA